MSSWFLSIPRHINESHKEQETAKDTRKECVELEVENHKSIWHTAGTAPSVSSPGPLLWEEGANAFYPFRHLLPHTPVPEF